MVAGQQISLFICKLLVLLAFWGHASADKACAIDDVPHVSHINLVLPPPTVTTVRFLLKAYNGCFSWRVMDEAVIAVEPVLDKGSDCCAAAYVWAVAGFEERRSSLLVAHELGTGMELSCEVSIERISRLQIVHDTLKLHLGHKEALFLQGFDREGNMFSSLEGLRFTWELAPLAHHPVGGQKAGAIGRSGDVPPIKFVPLDKVQKRVSETRRNVECGGFFADMLVVNGTSVGRSQITAVLEDSTASVDERLATAVNMTVAELLVLEPSPSPLYILPMSSLQLTLYTIRGDRRVLISMPTPHYRWTVRNDTVLTVDERTGLVQAGGVLGTTTCHVEDMRVPGAAGASITIVVATPATLLLSVSPHHRTEVDVSSLPSGTPPPPPAARGSGDSAPEVVMEGAWPLVVSRHYILRVVARTASGHRILLTNESAISTSEGTPGVMEVHREGPPGGVAAGGAGRMHARVLDVGEPAVGVTAEWHMGDGAGGLLHQWMTATQEVSACSAVGAGLPDLRAGSTPGEMDVALRLPHAKGLGQGFNLPSVLDGACQEPGSPLGQPRFRFGASPSGLTGVSKAGLVGVEGEGDGSILVAAFWDIYTGHNSVPLPLQVSLPSAAVRGGTKALEVGVGEEVLLEYVLLDATGARYHNCTAAGARATWEISGGGGGAATFQMVDARTPPGPAAVARGVCGVARLRAVTEGTATVQAQWTPTGHAPIAAVWHLAAFPALRVHFDGCQGSRCDGRNLLMAPGSAVVAGLRGGPGMDKRDTSRSRGGGDLLESLAVSCRVGGGPKDEEAGSVATKACDTAALQVEPLEACPWVECDGFDATGSPGVRHFAMRCAGPGAFVVNITLAGKGAGNRGRTGQQPAPSVHFDVTCEDPAALIIIVGREEQPSDQALEAAVASGGSRPLPPIPVLHGRYLQLHAVAVDKGGNPFVGTSALSYRWTLEPAVASSAPPGEVEAARLAMPGVELFAEGVRGQDEPCSPGRCYARSRWVWAPAEDGTVRVHVEATAVGAGGKEAISDEAELLLVGPVSLDPPSVLLFRGSGTPAHFRVAGGTRHLAASLNDTSSSPSSVDMRLVRPAHWSTGGEGDGRSAAALAGGGAQVRVSPLAGGGAAESEVGVTCVPTDSRGLGMVSVADLATVRVVLPPGASLQLGHNRTIGIEVLDSRGRAFHPSQIPAMDPQVHLHDARLGHHHPGGQLAVMGAAPGLSPIHVSVRSWNGTRVRSLVARITVFEPLTLQPPSIVLAPGASYTLVALGGAGPGAGVAVRFHTDDERVAAVDPHTGCVSAKGPGATRVWARAHSSAGEGLGTAFTEVDVPTLAGLRINVVGRLGVGREVAATVHGLGPREDVLAMGQVCWGYHWTVSNAEAVRLERGPPSPSSPPHSGGSSNASGAYLPPAATASTYARIGSLAEGGCGGLGVDNGFSVRLVGRQPGEAVVTVSATCATANTLEPSSPPTRFTASETVWVEPPLPQEACPCAVWLLPPLYTTGPLLPSREPEGPGAGGELLPVNYTVMQAPPPAPPVLTLDPQGRITTSQGPEVACIRASRGAGEFMGVAACVRVAPVTQLVLGGHAHNPPHSAELSMGATAAFAVTLQDESGALFGPHPPVAMALDVDNDHPQVVSAELSTGGGGKGAGGGIAALSVRALQQGTALVRVRLRSDPQIAGYVAVQVGVYVQPLSPRVLERATIQFSTGSLGAASPPPPPRRPDGSAPPTGPWASSDESVVRIDAASGLAVAIGPGAATVHYNSTQLTTYTPVTVVRVGAVAVTTPAGVLQLTNVPHGGRGAESGKVTQGSSSKRLLRYRFPVQFSDTSGLPVTDSAAGAIEQRIEFECRLEPPSAGRALPRSPVVGGDGEHASSSCELELRPPSAAEQGHDAVAVIATVVAGAGPGDEGGAAGGGAPETIEGRAELPFFGGFELQPGTPERIALSGRLNSSTVAILGNTRAVSVSWAQRDRLSVEPIGGAQGARSVYRVSVLPPSQSTSFTDTVVLTMASTGQRVEVPVRFDAPAIAGGAMLTSALKNVLVLLAGAAAALLFVLMFRQGEDRRPPRVGRPLVDAGDDAGEGGGRGGGAGVTPSRQRGSPYTPPPSGGFQSSEFIHSPHSGFMPTTASAPGSSYLGNYE